MPRHTEPAPLPPELQAAIDRAKANQGATAIVTLHRTIGDVPFSFKFRAGVPNTGVEMLGKFQRLARTVNPADLDVEETLDLVVEFLDVMALDDTATLIAHLLREQLMDFGILVSLQKELMERMSGRGFTQPSSSASGQPNTGSSSTAGTSPEVSTPLPSPSTGY